jgi:RNA polymerase sigma-70 factor (ECF subfamily)
MDEGRADEDLMLAYRDGDCAAFEALYQRSKGHLYRYLLHQLGEAEIAAELFQDIWLRVIRAHRRYTPQARFKTYLYHLAHNVLINHYRHHRAGFPHSYDQLPAAILERQAADPQLQPDVLAASRQQLERLLQLITALPEAPREVFLLREEAGLGMEEIARVIGVKPEIAKGRLHYALQFLRKGMRGRI